jgi:hypothetical protein
LVLDGVQVVRSGPRQHFSQNLIDGGVHEGWLTMARGQLVLHGAGGDVVYRIDRVPGYYCDTCQAPLDDTGTARAHVRAQHGLEWGGYRRDNFYACERQN